MLLISIDKHKKQPLYQQIVEQLIKLVEQGSICVDEILPSSRKMAETLGVNRTTVYRAYQELWAAGYLETTIGGYSKVRTRNKLTRASDKNYSGMIHWEEKFSQGAQQIIDHQSICKSPNDQRIDFSPLSPDKDILPYDDFKSCVNHVLRNEEKTILDYGESTGYMPLREFLSKQMQQHGIATSMDEIILTNGTQNGLELLFRALVNPGDCIVTENPSYAKALELAKFIGIKLVGIQMNAEGMDLDELDRYLKTHKPKLIYTIPTFHNPTGITTAQSHREKLLSICQKYKVPLIEDGFEEDMKYFGKAILPIKSMDSKQVVIYLGTFSKVLFPGVRVGWIVAPQPLINKLHKIKNICELSAVTLTQAAVFQFCKKGLYEIHKKRLHKVYRKRMQLALQACRKYLPEDKISFTKPDGGYLIWFTIKTSDISEYELVKKFCDAGVAISPGIHFFSSPSNQAHYRLSIASCKDAEIERGIKIIGEVISSFKNTNTKILNND